MTSDARGSRFVDVIGADGRVDGAVVLRSDAWAVTCPCGDEACDPDRYLSDRRPSEALAAHPAEAVALLAAWGGFDLHPVGAPATGDDDVGDELTLEASFPAGIEPVALRDVEAALEDVLDVGVVVTAVGSVALQSLVRSSESREGAQDGSPSLPAQL